LLYTPSGFFGINLGLNAQGGINQSECSPCRIKFDDFAIFADHAIEFTFEQK
jgi:hypothetical protein